MKQDSTMLISKFLLKMQISCSSIQTKVYLFLALLLALLFLGTVSAEATNYYVRPGATGLNNGSNWTNAYSSLSTAISSVARGNTIYIAAGSYGSMTFSKTVSGTSVMTIKKATVADHGTATGWLDSYGDGVAVFSYMSFSSSYWVVDGNTPNWSYGITITNTASDLGAIYTGQTLSNITIKSISIDNTGTADATRGLYLNGALTNFLISNVEAKYVRNDCFLIMDMEDSIMEYLYLHHKTLTSYHGDAFEIRKIKNSDIRYSKFSWNDQNIFFSGVAGSYADGLYIYGNLFFDQLSVGKPIHNHSSGLVRGPIYVYNNTFVNQLYSFDVGGMSGAAYNNLSYKAGVSSWGSLSHDYNASNDASLRETHGQTITSSIFTNYSGKVYTLQSATNTGTILPSPYKTDMLSNARGSDDTWDRGAYEFSSTGATKPSAPTITSIN